MSKKPVALAVGTALAGGLMLSGSAFSATPLTQGYLLGAQSTAETTSQDPAMTPHPMTTEATTEQEGHSSDMDAMDANHENKMEHEGSCGMTNMDSDRDGKISKSEFAASMSDIDQAFAAHDSNHDGFIDNAEMKAHVEGSCGADMKSGMEGNCGAKMKTGTEGKCGEGKCGEGKCGGSI